MNFDEEARRWLDERDLSCAGDSEDHRTLSHLLEKALNEGFDLRDEELNLD